MSKELEDLIKQYKELKRNKNIIKNIDKDYFFSFGEIVLNYIENSISKEVIKNKIKKVKKELKELDNLQFYNYDEYISTKIQAKIFYLGRIIKDYTELLEEE